MNIDTVIAKKDILEKKIIRILMISNYEIMVNEKYNKYKRVQLSTMYSSKYLKLFKEIQEYWNIDKEKEFINMLLEYENFYIETCKYNNKKFQGSKSLKRINYLFNYSYDLINNEINQNKRNKNMIK